MFLMGAGLNRVFLVFIVCLFVSLNTFASVADSCRELCRAEGGDVNCLRFTDSTEVTRPWQPLFELARIATDGASADVCSRKAAWQEGRFHSRGSECVWTETFGPIGSVEIRWPDRVEGVSEKISDGRFEIQFTDGARPRSVARDGQGVIKFGGDVLFVANLDGAVDRSKETLVWGTKDGFCFSVEQPTLPSSPSKSRGHLTKLN